MKLSPERLGELRSFARLERTSLLETRGRLGEDPLESLADMPSIDELVLRDLRDELLTERGQFAEFTMARLLGTGTGPDAVMHRQNADRVEFELLREIAAANPVLTVPVWEACGRLETVPSTDRVADAEGPRQE